LNIPKNTVASIVLKRRKFGTTKTLPRNGHPAKLNNLGRRALVTEVTKTQWSLTYLQTVVEITSVKTLEKYTPKNFYFTIYI
jgi:hypothetical protein